MTGGPNPLFPSRAASFSHRHPARNPPFGGAQMQPSGEEGRRLARARGMTLSCSGPLRSYGSSSTPVGSVSSNSATCSKVWELSIICSFKASSCSPSLRKKAAASRNNLAPSSACVVMVRCISTFEGRSLARAHSSQRGSVVYLLLPARGQHRPGRRSMMCDAKIRSRRWECEPTSAATSARSEPS